MGSCLRCGIWHLALGIQGRRSGRMAYITHNVLSLTLTDDTEFDEFRVSADSKVITKFWSTRYRTDSRCKSCEMETFVEPGAVRHGNFINYYDFNSASERLSLLPTDTEYWSAYRSDFESSPYLVLDVGCNAGNFTQLLYEFLRERVKKEIVVLGIDIDPTLIERAREHNQHPDSVFYHCVDIMDESAGNDCVGTHLAKYRANRFDVVSCMSITMWIHLNNGDDGLLRFLETVHRLSVTLVIEPQPWRCYQNAVRRMKRAKEANTFPLFGALKMRNHIEDDIQNYLQSKCRAKICFQSDATAWKRKICIYRNEDE